MRYGNVARGASPVVSGWVKEISLAVPEAMDDRAWRDAVTRALEAPIANEEARLAIAKGWVWSVVLPAVRPLTERAVFRGRPLVESWDALCAGARCWANLMPPFEAGPLGVVTGDDWVHDPQDAARPWFWTLRDAARDAGDPVGQTQITPYWARAKHIAQFGLQQAKKLVDVAEEGAREREQALVWRKLDPLLCMEQLINA